MQRVRTFLTALLALAPAAVQGAPQGPCIEAAIRAASESGVPPDLLVAITLVETRHAGTAWPWTINHQGKGSWYPDRDSAMAAVRQMLESGDAPDVGCFQINTGWHPDAFETVEDMFDPDANAAYAARFLRELHGSTGNWADAVAGFHSRDPDRGEAYLVRVGAVLAELQGQAPRMPSPAAPQRNGFPLLAGGPPATAGSLVPLLSRGVPLIETP